MFHRTIAVVALSFACAATEVAQAQSAPERRVIGTATLENIPPVPPEVMTTVHRYASSRPTGLADWMADGSMLISTRFGAHGWRKRPNQELSNAVETVFLRDLLKGGR